jgi:hypothetical protein
MQYLASSLLNHSGSQPSLEITVPKGYKLIQDGLEIKFVKKPDSRLLKWEDKETALSGCFIGAN